MFTKKYCEENGLLTNDGLKGFPAEIEIGSYVSLSTMGIDDNCMMFSAFIGRKDCYNGLIAQCEYTYRDYGDVYYGEHVIPSKKLHGCVVSFIFPSVKNDTYYNSATKMYMKILST